jgi:hypothetical protein
MKRENIVFAVTLIALFLLIMLMVFHIIQMSDFGLTL